MQEWKSIIGKCEEEKWESIIRDLAYYLNTYIDDEYKTETLESLICELDDRGVINIKWVEIN